MKVRLLDKAMNEVTLVPIPDAKANEVANAGVVTYQGRYFTYSGFEGNFFEVLRFVEAEPPVNLG